MDCLGDKVWLNSSVLASLIRPADLEALETVQGGCLLSLMPQNRKITEIENILEGNRDSAEDSCSLLSLAR